TEVLAVDASRLVGFKKPATGKRAPAVRRSKFIATQKAMHFQIDVELFREFLADHITKFSQEINNGKELGFGAVRDIVAELVHDLHESQQNSRPKLIPKSFTSSILAPTLCLSL